MLSPVNCALSNGETTPDFSGNFGDLIAPQTRVEAPWNNFHLTLPGGWYRYLLDQYPELNAPHRTLLTARELPGHSELWLQQTQREFFDTLDLTMSTCGFNCGAWARREKSIAEYLHAKSQQLWVRFALR
jgi:hypothetical protein